MLSLNYINNIKDAELKKLLLEFYSIHPTDIDVNFYRGLLNNTDNTSMIMKYKLADLLKKRLINDKLKEAFNIDDKYKYKKKIDISDNLIITKINDDYYDIFKSLTESNSIYRGYDVLVDFIRRQGVNLPKDDLEKINEFLLWQNNVPYYDRSKSLYLPMNDERKKLKGLLDTERSLIIPSKEFMDIRNKCLGNVGEYFVDDFLNILDRKTRFVSKDIGDGTGYDHHYMLDLAEMLVESKSTTKEDNDNDSFTLTHNEYIIMLDCLGLDHRTYTVARAFIDPETINARKIHILRAETNTMFVPLNYEKNCTYEYSHDDDRGKVFVKKIK